MPINQYVPASIFTLLGAATASILRIPAPCNGWLTELTVTCGTGPITTDAYFDINIAGVSIFAADPSLRPKIDAGNIGVTKALNIAVVKGDIITIDLDTWGAAPIGNPLDLMLTIKEGTTLKTTIFTTANIANDVVEDFTLPIGYGFVIVQVTVDFKAWVRAYITPAYRSADAARLITVAPVNEHGCILDINFDNSSNLTIDIANARFGLDAQTVRDGNIAFTLQNKDGSSHAFTITVKSLELEL